MAGDNPWHTGELTKQPTSDALEFSDAMRDDFLFATRDKKRYSTRGAASYTFFYRQAVCRIAHRLSTTSCRDAASISLSHLYERRSRVPVAMHDCYEGRCGNGSEFLWFFFLPKMRFLKRDERWRTTYCREVAATRQALFTEFSFEFSRLHFTNVRPQNRGNYFYSFALAEGKSPCGQVEALRWPRMHARFRTSTRTSGPDMKGIHG